MIKAFIVIATLLELYPQSWVAPVPAPESEFAVQFKQPVSLDEGAPVLLHGQIVGRVKQASMPSESTTSTISIFRSQEVGIRDGAVVLLSSRLVPRSTRPIQFIEILTPAVEQAGPARRGKTLSGYASFHEFWSSQETKNWIDSASASKS